MIERALDLDVLGQLGLRRRLALVELLLLLRWLERLGLGQAERLGLRRLAALLAQQRDPLADLVGQRLLALGRDQGAGELAVGLDLKVADQPGPLRLEDRERREEGGDAAEHDLARLNPDMPPLHERPRLLGRDEGRERALELVEDAGPQRLFAQRLLALAGFDRLGEQEPEPGQQQQPRRRQAEPDPRESTPDRAGRARRFAHAPSGTRSR